MPTRILILLSLAASAQGGQPTIEYVRTPEISLACRSADQDPVSRSRVWLTQDGGRSWVAQPDVDGAGPASFLAPGDGSYGFYFVLENSAGVSAPSPEPGARPHAIVVVDSAPPLVQVHAARLSTLATGKTALAYRATIVEESLGPEGCRIFYRTAAGWRDGGTVTPSRAETRWSLPEDVAGSTLDCRLVITDLAGNQTTQLLYPLRVVNHATTQPSTTAEAREDEGRIAASRHVAVAVEPVRPVARVRLTSNAAPEPAAPSRRVDGLRALADEFAQRGERGLAAARLEDAQALDPENPAVLVDLAQALYRDGRYADAEAQFQAVLTRQPQHVPALEGLALVAATRRDYPAARQRLREIVALEPAAQQWLRLGDIEHRLGHEPDALAAWRRVADDRSADTDLRENARRRLNYFAEPRRPAP